MSSQRLITAFWEAATDPEVGDLLFSRSNHLEPGRHTKAHHIAVSSAVAGRFYKGDLGHVIVIATNPLTAPDVLARFAKDPRVSVRRALIENPATPQPVVHDLALWALDRLDESVGDAVSRLGLDDIVALPDALRERRLKVNFERAGIDATALAVRACDDPSKAVGLASLGNVPLTTELAALAHTGQIAGVSVTDLLGVHPQATDAVIEKLLRSRKRLSVELAGIWIGRSRARRQYPHGYQGYDTERFAEVEPGAADRLVREAATIGQFLTGATNGVDDVVLRQTVADRRCALLFVGALVDVLGTVEVSPETERAIVSRAIGRHSEHDDSGRFRPADLLVALRHPLPDADLLGLLRSGNFETTRTWLSNTKLVNRPRPGLVSELWGKPGLAFSDANGVREQSRIREWLRSSLVDATALDPALLGDLLALHDDWLGMNLVDRDVARAVWPLVSQRFSSTEKLSLWETFIGLAEDWQDSLTALLDTCTALMGDPAPESVTGPADDPSAPGSHQLSLL